MFRFVITCLFYSTVAHWGYNEVSLMFPAAVPYLNKVIAQVQIPTHNTWSRQTMYDYVDVLSDKLSDAEGAITDIESIIDNRSNGRSYEP